MKIKVPKVTAEKINEEEALKMTKKVQLSVQRCTTQLPKDPTQAYTRFSCILLQKGAKKQALLKNSTCLKAAPNKKT